MDASFIPIEVVPSKTPFGLDQLRRSYKSALSAAAAIAAAPAVGTADETFPNMFLMPISTPESAESATRVDLLYMGCLAGAEGDPTLPASQHNSGSSIQSATSSRGRDGSVLTVPATIQFYAPYNELSYFSAGAAGTTEADEPAGDIVIINFTFGDTSYSPGNLVNIWVALFFDILVEETHDSSEIVPAMEYWQNTSRKTKTYVPFVIELSSGPHVSLCGAGTGYAVGNSISISSGGESATVTVDAVSAAGVILGMTETFNDFTTPQSCVAATGGSGSGALLTVTIIP